MSIGYFHTLVAFKFTVAFAFTDFGGFLGSFR